MKSSVYILGFPNGKCYVGITGGTVDDRFKTHTQIANSKIRVQTLHHALRKYGEKNVRLMSVVTGVSWKQAQDCEIWWISRLGTFGAGYNMTAGGEGTVGCKPSAETRAKLSKAHLGKKFSAETRAKMTGRKHTAEARAKISKAQMGKTKAKGYKLSAETRAKMSKARMGHIITAETRAKIGKANKGKKHTEKQNTKHKEAMRGRKCSEETKAKMSKAQKAAWIRRRCRFSIPESQLFGILNPCQI